MSPSSVTWACNPSGGIKVIGCWPNATGWERRCKLWPARSKPGVESCGPCGGSGFVAPRVEGTAPDWIHRAAQTSCLRQWKDHGLVRIRLIKSQLSWPNLTITFFAPGRRNTGLINFDLFDIYCWLPSIVFLKL